MIIACPECTGPFEIPDDRIAALVQIECPHCSFRMILDFAAANDPSLVEEGMRMASGYRTAVDYRASAETSAPALEPVVRPAPPPPLEEHTTRPEPALRPVASAPAAARVSETSATRPYMPESSDPARRFEQTRPSVEVVYADEAPTRAPPSSTPQPVAEAATRRGVTEIGHVSAGPPYEPATPAARGETQVGPAPTPPMSYPPDYDEDAPTRVHDIPIAAQAADLPAPSRAPVAAPRPVAPQWSPPVAPVEQRYEAPPEDIETRPEAELPAAPTHRPPARVATVAPVAREARVPAVAAVEVPRRVATPAYDDLDTPGEYDEIEFKKKSVAGTVVVTILLMVALALVGASLGVKGTADPRPLLEDLYRQHVK